MRNDEHKRIYASLLSDPLQIFPPPEAETHIPILINDIVDLLEVRMLRHCGEDVVAGRTESIGVPEGKTPPLPIPIIPHLTDNKEGVTNEAE